MIAKDVMTTTIVSVRPTTPVHEIAQTLLASNISAVPVVDAQDRLVGIVSEGDLLNRPEGGTQHDGSLWKRILAGPEKKSDVFRHMYGCNAGHLMSWPVVTVNEQASLSEVAAVLEEHKIKRAPVLRSGRMVGLVSRADLLRPLIDSAPKADFPLTDQQLVERVEQRLHQAGVGTSLLRAYVVDGVLHLAGLVGNERELTNVRIAVDSLLADPGKSVVEVTVREQLPESV